MKLPRFLSDHKKLILVSLIFFVIRLPFLSQLSLLHDERDIVLTGYSLAKTGHDLFGNFLPFTFPELHPKTPFVSLYYSALWWFILPTRSIFFARLPFVVISTLIPVGVYVFAKEVTDKKTLALLTAVVVAFNPWVFHISRMALEINIVLPLTLFAAAYYLKNKKFASYLLFTIVLFTYQGFRVLVPVLLVALLWFEWMRKSAQVKRSILMLFVFTIGMCLAISVIDGKTTTGRMSELIFFNTEKLAADVDYKRNTSVAPDILRQTIHNKATASVDYIVDNFTKAQDITFLFNDGDASPINGSVSGGQFLFPFIVAYYAGFLYLGKKLTLRNIFPAFMVLVGFAPALLSGRGASFGIRGAFSAVGYGYIIACGLILLHGQWVRLNKKSRALGLLILMTSFVAVFVSVGYFGYTYYFRRPVMAGEEYFERERQLSKYLLNAKQSYTIYHPYPHDGYMSYVFFDQSIDMENVKPDPTNKFNLHAGIHMFVPCADENELATTYPAIYAKDCLTPEIYEQLLANGEVEKIPYHNFSNEVAYFVIFKGL